jgi:hypothetical protein
VNTNISLKLCKDGKEWEREVSIHSATGCYSIILCNDSYMTSPVTESETLWYETMWLTA